MHESVASVIDFAGSHRPGTGYELHERELERLVSRLPMHASGALTSFRLGDDDETSGDLVPINDSVPLELSCEVNSCWNEIRGPYEPDRGFAVLAAARIEYTRCTLFDLLNRYRRACQEHDDPSIESARALLAKTDWSNADQVTMLPHAVIFQREDAHIAGDTAGRVFRLWLQDGDPKEWGFGGKLKTYRKFEAFELLDGLALVSLDAAASCSVAGLELTSRAAGARFHAAIAASWSRKKTDTSLSESKSSNFSQQGHNARHARSREMKAAAILEFRDGAYRNKDEAAEQIAQKLGYAYPTVRRWLTNA